MGLKHFFINLWAKIEGALSEILAHFIVSAAVIAAITVTESFLRLAGIGDKPVPLLHISLSEWMLGLDVVGASAILVIGMFKAVRELMA